ncbi:MAG: D-alanine--D-alanine ligase [Clostridia bacterium]|nr:D-alanine--D-alanine ligase [Clostridia bacterium]
MNTTKKCTLAVLFGGESSEHEISLVSTESVLKQLDADRYRVLPVGITREGLWWYYDGAYENIASGEWERDTAHLTPVILSPCKAHGGLLFFDKEKGTYRVEKIDCVFPVMHGETCEDGKLQGLLALSGVPYVGCATRSSAVTMDKISTKLLLSAYGIPQAKWTLAYRRVLNAEMESELSRIERALPYPVFVKPSGAGSSRGVCRAENREELKAALLCAAEFDEKILIEEAVSGSEVEVALLERVTENGSVELFASTPGEIVPDGTFYDYDAKYVKGTSLTRAPALISVDATRRVQDLARRIFTALDCTSLSRADFFVDGETVVFNEINTLPGFTSISMYPKLFSHDGIAYSALLDAIIDRAVKAGGKQ